MKVAIIGAGNVGKALATSISRAGHEVTISASTPESALEAADALGVTAAESNVDAAQQAGVIILAVPYVGAGPEVAQEIRDALDDEFVARPMTEAVARALQAAELMRHGTQEVADAFLGTRCAGAVGAWGSMFGTMATGLGKAQADRIVERADVLR